MTDANTSGESASAPELETAREELTSHEIAARDEKGRFASPKEPEVPIATPAADAGGKPQAGTVPQEALHAERRKNDDLRRELDELKGYVKGAIPKPPEPEKKPMPSWWEVPDEALTYRLDEFGRPIQEKLTSYEKSLEEIRQQNAEFREYLSKERAVDKHGEEVVNAAFEAFKALQQADPMGMKPTYDKIMASPHMYGELIKWHQQQAILSKVGADPDAYIEAEVKRRLAARQGAVPAEDAEPDGDADASPPAAAIPAPKPKPLMPSNLATARNAGARTTPGWNGPRPLDQIMGR